MSNKSFFLVALQFIAFAILIFYVKPIAKDIWLIIQIIGFSIALTASINLGIGNFNIQPEIKKEAVFKTTGLYHYLRNPIYSGLILYFSAIVASDLSILSGITLSILIIVLIMKIEMEEKFLADRFGEKYIAYKSRTKRLIPYIY